MNLEKKNSHPTLSALRQMIVSVNLKKKNSHPTLSALRQMIVSVKIKNIFISCMERPQSRMTVGVKKLLNRICLFFEGFLLINIIWYIGYLFVHSTVIPNPILVYQNFDKILADHILIHILSSLERVGLGLGLSLFVGIPMGILMAYSKGANKILYPLVYFSYPIPKTALLPIAMLLWGMRDGSKIAIIFLIIVFQVIVAVRDSVQNIDPSLYLVTVSAGASKSQIIWHITLPAILPELLTSLRVSIGTAVSVLFFVEGYGTRYGMGYYIVDAWSRIDYIGMYSGIIVISIVGFALFAAVDFISAKLCPWR